MHPEGTTGEDSGKSGTGPERPASGPETGGDASARGSVAPIGFLERASAFPTSWVWAISLAVVALLAYSVGRRIATPSAPPIEAPLDQSQQALLDQASRYYQAGRYDETVQASRALLKIDPNSADAYNNMAVAYLGLKNYDEAIRSAEQALRLRPEFQLARNNLVWIRQEQAKSESQPAAAAAPGTAEFFLNQSLSYYQAGRYPECIDAARQALKLHPDYAAAYNNIAAASAGLGKWDEAILNAQLALHIDPNFQLAKNNLAWAVSEQAKLKGARAK